MKNLKDSHCFRWLSFVISSPDNQRLAGREQRIEGSVQREALRLRTLGTISGWKTKDRHQKTEGRLLNIESRCSFKLYLAAQGIGRSGRNSHIFLMFLHSFNFCPCVIISYALLPPFNFSLLTLNFSLLLACRAQKVIVFSRKFQFF